MIRWSRPLGLAAAAALALVACSKPPADVYVGSARSGQALDLGKNTANEACSLQQGANNAEIFCGSYLEPAGRVDTQTTTADPSAFLGSSPWRSSFDSRFLCGSPTSTTVLGAPAATLSCTRRQGGWQQVVLATSIDGKMFVADGVRPVESVLPKAIGVVAGKVSASPAAALDSGLEAQRSASQAVNIQGAGAIAEVQRQMQRGAMENRRGNYAAAESAYRAAISIQERIVGADNPALAVPVAREALQVSNQGRYAEADRLFARAEKLVSQRNQIDPLARPMVADMRALDLLNRDKPAEALPLLKQAEQGFLKLVPPDALRPRARNNRVARTTAERLAQEAEDMSIMSDPTANQALNSVIETRRYQAIALAEMGRTQDAEAALQSAADLYAGRDPRLAARFYRTVGMGLGDAGVRGDAADLQRAVDNFNRGQPGTMPLAETQLLHAARLAAAGSYSSALPECRSAAKTLGTLKGGVEPALLIPCLDALNTEVARGGQPVLAEMFALSQLAQGSITSRQIALAAARLAESARDPKVADAINAYDAATAKLETLYRRRLELGGDKDSTSAKALDEEIRKAVAAQRDAGEARQAASPGFAALVQESVSAADVQALLGPDEAVATMVVGPNEGWTLLIRKDSISAGRISGGAAKLDGMVKAFRDAMELGRDNRPHAFNIAAARGIYDAVLAPVQSGLSGVNALTVAPAGSLLSVPFAALLTGPAEDSNLSAAPFLIKQYAISHVPSAASFVNLRKGAKTVQARNPWFGMGDFKPPSLKQAMATFPVDACGDSAKALASLPPLPGAVRELEVARQLEGAAARDQLLGMAFTSQAVLKAPLKNFRIVHFATHAILPGELRCQAEPAVLTSTPPNAPNASAAMLTASQIQQMELDAELVILAACNTGGANGAAGESLSGLARAFFFAGARSLLVTHWEANDATTLYLTALFLGNLNASPQAGPAMALANAQRRMLSESVGERAVQAHPYYWAVAALIGGRGEGGGGKMAAVPGGPAGG
ncbi:MAG: CHAT domain-containing protein [Proteobacteria bacterium]|nr:CHAT domain-containing protein [Pseudomonadota bacterium]